MQRLQLLIQYVGILEDTEALIAPDCDGTL